MSKRPDLMSPEELAELREHFNGLGLDMTLERYVELKSELTDKELVLAQEYEASTDPERRDAIRRELYNLRWRLNSENDRKYNTTGKGRHFAALNGDAAQRRCGSDTSRWLEEEAKKLLESPEHAEIKHTLPTLCAIIRNRRNRAEAIRELMRQLGCSYGWAEKKYYADRKLLQKYFCVMGGK